MDSGTQIAIAASVFAAIASLISAVVAAYFGYQSSKRSRIERELERLVNKRTADLRRCYRQIASYYELEAQACKQIEAATGRNASTGQRELRDAVVGEGLDRPAMTRTEAERRLDELAD